MHSFVTAIGIGVPYPLDGKAKEERRKVQQIASHIERIKKTISSDIRRAFKKA